MELGTGIPLYFQFVKSFAVVFFIMTLLSIPSFIFCYSGEAILPVDRDSLGLYRFTLGNIGYNKLSPTYDRDSACMKVKSNTTCVHLPLGQELPLYQASQIMTAMEFLQVRTYFENFLVATDLSCHLSLTDSLLPPTRTLTHELTDIFCEFCACRSVYFLLLSGD